MQGTLSIIRFQSIVIAFRELKNQLRDLFLYHLPMMNE
ncbi:hypothetical protein H5410_004721 [Solanum commersonii]|uniref:Uncharacterized protein n=1 Tax=Solanum commersonii TaxID=4109 RepID=A0A9J6A609_SOLCO|nr:hypothetical protein H5410_004721 [Solanum commersonii]